MVAALTYASYKTELALLAVVDEDDENFVSNLPSAINYAELRIYQDLQLLATVVTNTDYTLTANENPLEIDIEDFIVLQTINVLTPAGTTNPNLGTRNPLTPTTREALQMMYPSASGAALPTYMAPVSQNTFFLGPWPDAAYRVELIGTVRPTSLSSSNTTTYLSTYLPTHLLFASMIFISGYQRNFGRQSDDPQMAVSYESQYKALLTGAMTEEGMRRFQSSGWTAQAPAPTASPPRQ